VSAAAGLLGFRYHVRAEIVRGKQLGRTLGFPTANMVLPEDVALRHGIYAVRFVLENGARHDGVASFGRRPTVDTDGGVWLETFLFDYSGDLYGQRCMVTFVGWLRGEEKFADVDALVTQMKRDERAARSLLENTRPLSDLDRLISFDPAR
jgi:riboflavin kinase/FMN adenylyltransferase